MICPVPPREAAPAVPRWARWLALGAVAGPALFAFTWLVLGFLSEGYTLYGHRFTHYSPISQPVSGLGMGSTAPVMNAAFIAGGLLLTAGVVGVLHTTAAGGWVGGRRASAVLLGATGLGQVVDGIFNLEATLPHTLGFLAALGTPVVSFLVAGRYLRRVPGWRRFGSWLVWGSPLTLVLLVLFFLTFQPTADGAESGVAGLVQRVGIVEVHAWFVAMGWLAFRRRRPGWEVTAMPPGLPDPAADTIGPVRDWRTEVEPTTGKRSDRTPPRRAPGWWW